MRYSPATDDGTTPDAAQASPESITGEPLAQSAVAFYRCDDGTGSLGHDHQTKIAVSRMLADLLDRPFAGVFDQRRLPPPALYLIPSQTLCDDAELSRLGIRDPSAFFGGAVPWAFVATKVITHPTVPQATRRPVGWNPQLGALLTDSVVPGFSVFSATDARNAGLCLLAGGAVRIKSAAGVGGAGQSVARDLVALDSQLAAIDPDALAGHGWVVERNLDQVSTFSVGQIQIGPWTAAYVGTQRNTMNHLGHEVYGGSTLDVVRGDIVHLLSTPLPVDQRRAVQHALHYHEAVRKAYPGMFASRINYDVVQGTDARGQWLCGVLEQSWRIGGASGAEVAALHAFKADPLLRRVRTATREIYHEDRLELPTACTVLYDDTDPTVGRLTKYAEVVADVGL